jgi:ammonia channel protein AmtB
LLVVSTILTFLAGFALAYGDPHILGYKYFWTVGLISDENKTLGLNFATLMLTCTIVSSMATSSMNERLSLYTQVIIGIFVSGLFVPIVTAWTFG